MNTVSLFDTVTVTGVLSRFNSNRIEIERDTAKMQLVEKRFHVDDIVVLQEYGRYVHIERNSELPKMIYHVISLGESEVVVQERNGSKTHRIYDGRNNQLFLADNADIAEYDNYKPDPVAKKARHSKSARVLRSIIS